jgi:rod shape-determining protein MreC
LKEVAMTTMQRTNKATRTLTFTKIQAGIAQHVTTAIVLGGVSTTQAALSGVFQAAIQAQTDLDDARAAVTVKVQAHKAALAAAIAAEELLHRYVEATYGPESPVLGDFGFAPEKTAEKSAAVKAAASANATKKAKKPALAAATSPAATPEPAAPAAPAAPAKS